MTDRDDMRARLRIEAADADAVNQFLASPDNPFVESLFDVLDKYGGVDQINGAADEAGKLETRLERLRDERSPYLAGVEWLAEQRDAGAFVTLAEYRRGVLGGDADAAGAAIARRRQRCHPRDQRPAVLPLAAGRSPAGGRTARAHARALHPRTQHGRAVAPRRRPSRRRAPPCR